MLEEDRSDTKRALVQHHPTGELYIIEYCPVWQGQQCVGTRVIAGAGPIRFEDLGLPRSLIEYQASPAAEAYDAIDRAVNLSDEDAEWLQGEDAGGRFNYPLGVR